MVTAARDSPRYFVLFDATVVNVAHRLTSLVSGAGLSGGQR